MKKKSCLAAIFVLIIVVCGSLFSGLAYNTGDDYPYKGQSMDEYDPWLFYKRNCTSFVAWCINSRNGVEFNNWYGGVKWGWAGNWMDAARSLGILVDNNPAVGSIACESGHVAWVREVNGNNVTIDEYNWGTDGIYHTRTFDKSHYLGYIHIKDLGNKAPYGYFDGLEIGKGYIRVTGWAKDDDTPNQSIAVHVYVGGEAGSGAPCYGFPANKYRSDVGSHAFDEIIYTNKTGNQSVYIYAIDPLPNSHNPQIGVKTAYFNGDTQAPVISNVQITDISSKGYTVTCDVSDDVALDRVAFPTWTMDNGQDDIFENWGTNPKALGTISNGKVTYRVNIADHNNETHCEYRTHIYAWDKAGNEVKVTQQNFSALSFVLPVPVPAPEITNALVNGNTIQVKWNESPLTSADDVRTYKLVICQTGSILQTYYSQEGITGSSIVIHPTTLSNVAGDAPGSYSLQLTAINETTGEASDASKVSIHYIGEFELPEVIEIEEGDFISQAAFLQMLSTESFNAAGIKYIYRLFKLTSSDQSVLETYELSSMAVSQNEPMLKAKKPGTAELTVWFVGQSNTVRTTTVKVKSLKDMDNVLPENVRVIDEEAFMGSSMISIAIPDGCTSIGSRAFANSVSLEKIYIPASVKTIISDAFENCPKLTIYSEADSTAIQLAKTLGIPYRTVE